MRQAIGPFACAARCPVDVGEYVNLGAVAGIEIYTRSNTPFEFAMLSGNCGVVVIWTK